MFYVKTNSLGELDCYPYTLTDLKRDNKNVSFSNPIDDESIASFGVYPVTPQLQPPYNYTKNVERTAVKTNDGWVEQWVENNASAEEITQRTELKAAEVRSERNQKLIDTDWTQLADSSANTAAWATYRQALRDLPTTDGWPHNVTWPTKPS